jgi:hypothetical protein
MKRRRGCRRVLLFLGFELHKKEKKMKEKYTKKKKNENITKTKKKIHHAHAGYFSVKCRRWKNKTKKKFVL